MSLSSDRLNKLRVFVSYSRDDIEFADQLVLALKVAGCEPSIDRHGISGGENWQERLGGLIRDSETVVFVLSPSSAQSKICDWEVMEATRLGKRIIPVVCRTLGDVAAPAPLRMLNYIFFYADKKVPGSGFGFGLEGLVGALNTDLDWIREHARLLLRASEWDAGNRAANRLLSGDDIAAAKAWVARRPTDAPEPTLLHRDFIRASEELLLDKQNQERQRLEERERLVRESEAAAREKAEAARRAEAAVKEREQALLQVVEEQKAREAALKASARNRRRYTIAGACFLALALGVAVWSILQSRVTERRQAIVAFNLADRAIEDQSYEDAMRIGVGALPIPTRSPFSIGWGGEEIGALEAKLAGAAQASPLLLLLQAHKGAVNGVALSADGKRVASVASDRSVFVSDAASGVKIAEMKGHGSIVQTVAFSPDGQHLATGSSDRSARIWDAATGIQVLELKGHGRPVTSVAWSPDGSLIATGSLDRSVRIWRVSDGAMMSELGGATGAVRSVGFDPYGKRLFAGSLDGSVRIYDVATGTQVLLVSVSPAGVTSAAFNADGNRLVAATSDRVARIYDAANGAFQFELRGHGDKITSVAWSRDGRLLVTTSGDRSARLWDATTGVEIERLNGHRAAVLSAAIDPSGHYVVTGSADGTIRMWDTTRRLGTIAEERSNGIRTARFSHDGELLVTCAGDGTARISSTRDGHIVSEIKLPGNSFATDAVFSSDRRLTLVAAEDGNARIYETESAALVRELVGHEASIRSVRVNQQGDQVLTASDDGSVRAWDLATGKLKWRFKGHRSGVTSAEFNFDGTRVLTASVDGTARIWNPLSADRPELSRLTIGAAVSDASFSNDGALIVTASADNTVRIWGAARGDLKMALKGHTSAVLSAVFSHDNTRILTASADGTARLWDAASGLEILRYGAHGAQVRSAAFDADDNRMATASDDGTVRISDVSWVMHARGDRLIARVCTERLVGDTAISSVDEANNPALRASFGASVCERKGPLTPAYWMQQLAGLWRPKRVPPEAPAFTWDPPNPSTRFEDIADEYLESYETARFDLNHLDDIDWYVSKITKNRARYEAVEKVTQVPWYFIGLLHGMESGFDFKSHLHNGDSLERRTVHVPAGRPKAGTPPFTWEESAIDALELEHFAGLHDWDLAHTIYRLEAYNGFGMRKTQGRATPYLWSFSSAYTAGKYVADGVFDPNAESRQCGSAVVLKMLIERGIVALAEK